MLPVAFLFLLANTGFPAFFYFARRKLALSPPSAHRLCGRLTAKLQVTFSIIPLLMAKSDICRPYGKPQIKNAHQKRLAVSGKNLTRRKHKCCLLNGCQ
jgi:hypothetical protein